MGRIDRRVEVPGLSGAGQWGYAHVVEAGDLIFVAGQAGQDEHGNLVSLEFDAQARQTFANIDRALQSVGSGLADIVSMTSFITDWRYAPALGEIRKELMGDNLAPDALIGVSQLALPGMLLEVQVTAKRQG
jgi:enamine deaminase RidA (YjgF/YER057c/UK114 family)